MKGKYTKIVNEFIYAKALQKFQIKRIDNPYQSYRTKTQFILIRTANIIIKHLIHVFFSIYSEDNSSKKKSSESDSSTTIPP